MRICLFWNPTAGEGVSLPEITGLIERAGHTFGDVVEKARELDAAQLESFDCVVAAGGDGTVARAGRLLAGGRVPLAILTLGTANNIATSLGVSEDPAQAVAAWARQQVVRVDVGVVHDARGRSVFLEGVGAGLIPAGIEESRRTIDKLGDMDSDAELAAARDVFRRALATLAPRRWGLTIDGTLLEEESLLVEVLNTPFVGPRIRLSKETNPVDGLLSVVIGNPADRERIADHLRRRWDYGHHAQLKTWRARQVEVRGWGDYHVDDEVRAASGGTVSILIEPGALPILM